MTSTGAAGGVSPGEALFSKGAFRAHHLALISMIIGFLAGYDSGVAGGILTFESFEHDFGYSGKADTNRVNSLTVSLQILGCFLSCFVAGFTTEKIGRRKGVWVFASIFIVGVILQVSPTNKLGAWYFARIVSGFGQGGLTVVVPIFTAEMAPAHIRGRLGSLYQWMFTLGIFTAYWINYGMQQNVSSKSNAQWQIPVGLQMISASILFGGMFTVPESVRWLLKKGKDEEAWESLVWVRASSDSEVESEFAKIKQGLAEEIKDKSNLRITEMFMGENRSRVVSGSLSFFFQQATGGSALAYFGPQFFIDLVGKGPRDLLLTGLFGAVKLIACTFFVFFLASRVGRRLPMVAGALFMFACMFPIAIILATIPIPDDAGTKPVPPSGIATIALVYLNVMAYNFSWGPLPWAYVPEIFPNRTRELGMSICLTVHWLFNFVFTFATPYMINGGTGKNAFGTFLFYAVFDLIMAAWAFFSMKETKDKSLEHVNREIDSGALHINRKIDEEDTGDDQAQSHSSPALEAGGSNGNDSPKKKGPAPEILET